MPKPRKQNTRKPNYRIFILCEGEKSEPNYLNEIIGEVPLPQELITITVVKTKKNTAKELVKQGKNLKETQSDQVWIVIDKDGYTQHPSSFDMARANGINIAFSSISFETWVLMHFRYTTRVFNKSEQIISLMNANFFPGAVKYEKNIKCLYGNHLKPLTGTAIKNAVKLRKSSHAANPKSKIYTINPYTNIDLLLDVIKKAQKKFTRKK